MKASANQIFNEPDYYLPGERMGDLRACVKATSGFDCQLNYQSLSRNFFWPGRHLH
jgi:hypothetical protein